MSALLLGGENTSTRGNRHHHCSNMSSPIRIQCRPPSASSADSGSSDVHEGGGVSALTAALRDSTQSLDELTIGSLPSHLKRGNPRTTRSAAPGMNTASARLGVSLPVPRAPFLSARMKKTTNDIPEMVLPESAVGTDSATASTPQQYGSLRERNFHHPGQYGGAASSMSKNMSNYQLDSGGHNSTLSQSLTAFDLMSRHLHSKKDGHDLKARAKPLERIDSSSLRHSSSMRDSGLSASLTAMNLLQGEGKSQGQTSHCSSNPNHGISHHNEADLAEDEGTEASGDGADSDMCFEFDD